MQANAHHHNQLPSPSKQSPEWDVCLRNLQADENSTILSNGSQTSAEDTASSWSSNHSSSRTVTSPSLRNAALMNPLTMAPPTTQPARVSAAVLKSRESAYTILAACRSSLVQQELTRLTKARRGAGEWISFWRDIYDPKLYRALSRLVGEAMIDTDAIFRGVVTRLCAIISETTAEMQRGESEKQIKRQWQRFEQRVRAFTMYRAEAVDRRLGELRETVEAIPIEVGDDLFMSLKRSIFAIDVTADYEFDDDDDDEEDLCDQENIETYTEEYEAEEDEGSVIETTAHEDPDGHPVYTDGFHHEMEQNLTEETNAAVEVEIVPRNVPVQSASNGKGLL